MNPDRGRALGGLSEALQEFKRKVIQQNLGSADSPHLQKSTFESQKLCMTKRPLQIGFRM